MRVTRVLIATTALAAGVSLMLAHPAGAHATKTKPPTVTVLTTAVGAPFNLDVGKGKVLVADGGTESIGQLKPDGTVKTLISGVPGAEGVATSADGRYLAYTTTVGGPPEGITASGLVIKGPRGFQAQADTLAFERAKNLDRKIRYGVKNPSQCVIDELTRVGFPVSYTGVVDSHAYSVAAYGNRWVVADAGANALLWVTRSGKISKLAVLPSQPARITAEAAATRGRADCVGGVN